METTGQLASQMTTMNCLVKLAFIGQGVFKEIAPLHNEDAEPDSDPHGRDDSDPRMRRKIYVEQDCCLMMMIVNQMDTILN